MAFIDEPFVKIDWEPESGCIVANWSGIGRGAAYRSALDRSLELVKRHSARRWLGNMLDASGVMSQEDSDWLLNDWFPRLLAHGAKRFAVVLPPHALAAMQLNRMKRTIDDEKPDPNVFQTLYFDDIGEARRWLAKG